MGVGTGGEGAEKEQPKPSIELDAVSSYCTEMKINTIISSVIIYKGR